MRLFAAVVVGIGVAAGSWKPARAQDASTAPAAGAEDSEDKKFPFDTGPDTVDVSAYPEAQQKNYKVFSAKCSKCHTLARPINSPFALPDEWKEYVTKMQHKKRSGIDEDSAAAIIDFLVYDSSVRKKDIIAQKSQDKKSDDKKSGSSAP